MLFNKVFILGAGAIGSVYGGSLSKKNDVTLIGEKEHILAIKSKGLKINNKIFHLKAETEIKKIPKNSLILLTTKAHQSVKAIREIKNLIRKDTLILILQNGLGQEELIKKSLRKKCQILRGIIYVAAEFFQPGEIRAWPNKKTILPFSPNGQRIAKILKEAGLSTELTREMKKEIWKKLVVNCVIGPMTALFKGRKTEIDFLNGKIIELAKKHRLETPANEVIYHLIKFLEIQGPHHLFD